MAFYCEDKKTIASMIGESEACVSNLYETVDALLEMP